jgi:hypothetical protein
LRLKVLKNAGSCFLAEFVDLAQGCEFMSLPESSGEIAYLVVGHIFLDNHFEHGVKLVDEVQEQEFEGGKGDATKGNKIQMKVRKW